MTKNHNQNFRGALCGHSCSELPTHCVTCFQAPKAVVLLLKHLCTAPPCPPSPHRHQSARQ